VRVRKAEEDGGELGSGEEVREEFHRVCADRGDVLVGAGSGGWLDGTVLRAQGGDAVRDIVKDLNSKLHALVFC